MGHFTGISDAANLSVRLSATGVTWPERAGSMHMAGTKKVSILRFFHSVSILSHSSQTAPTRPGSLIVSIPRFFHSVSILSHSSQAVPTWTGSLIVSILHFFHSVSILSRPAQVTIMRPGSHSAQVTVTGTGSLIAQMAAGSITAEYAWTCIAPQQTLPLHRISPADECNSIPSFIHRCGQNGIFQAICDARLSTGVDFRTV